MKRILKIFLVSFIPVLLLGSCYDDKGNYDYIVMDELMPVEIIDIPEITCPVYTYLTVKPDVNGIENKDDYTYAWYAYRSSGIKVDTLSYDYMLDEVFIDLSLGTYKLTYMVKHKVHGIARYFTTTLNVVAEYHDGWFVMKEEGGFSDIDFASLSGDVQEGLFEKANGYRLEGNPVKMFHQVQGFSFPYTNEDGTVGYSYSGALHLLTDRDAATIDPSALRAVYHGSEMLYDERTVMAPLDYSYDNPTGLAGMAFINNGRIHSLALAQNPVSKFGIPLELRDGSDHYLTGGMLYSSFSGILVFDGLNNRFLQADHGGSLREFAASDEVPFPSDMKHEMIRFLPRKSQDLMTPTAYAVMREISSGEYKIFAIDFEGYTSNLFSGIFEVPADSKIPEADCMAAHLSGSAIYFSTGGKELYYHNVSTYTGQRERVIHSFPGDERIVFIGQHKIVELFALLNGPLVVITQNGNKWKLYEFEFDSDTSEIVTTPVFTCEGTGNAGYAVKV